jgi:hypothetical protein
MDADRAMATFDRDRKVAGRPDVSAPWRPQDDPPEARRWGRGLVRRGRPGAAPAHGLEGVERAAGLIALLGRGSRIAAWHERYRCGGRAYTCMSGLP